MSWNCLTCGLTVADGETHSCYSMDGVPTPVGWLCPRCGKVHAPSVLQCDCTRETAYLGEKI